MWDAQVFYVRDLLGDCYDSICTTLTNANLPEDDENYAAIPSDWAYATLLDEYVKPLIVKAATLLYIHNYGFDDMDIGLAAREEREEYVSRLEGYVNSLQQLLQTHLVANEETYKCGCAATEAEENPALDSGSWLASTKYPNFMNVDSEPACDPDATDTTTCQ